jgi:hypothetical protein
VRLDYGQLARARQCCRCRCRCRYSFRYSCRCRCRCSRADGRGSTCRPRRRRRWVARHSRERSHSARHGRACDTVRSATSQGSVNAVGSDQAVPDQAVGS